MKTQFFSLIIFFFNTFLFSAQCVTLYITEHQSGSPICNLQEGSYIEICGDEVIGCPRNLYIYKKGSQAGSIVYNLTLDQGWTTHYGKLLVNPNTMRLGFEIQGQTAVYSYSTKPMSDERKRELQRKEEEERKQRLQKEEEKKQKMEKRQNELDVLVNNIKSSLVNSPDSIHRIYCSVNFEYGGKKFHRDSIIYFDIIHFLSYDFKAVLDHIDKGEIISDYIYENEAITVCEKIGDDWRLPSVWEVEMIKSNSGLLAEEIERYKDAQFIRNQIAIRPENFQRISMQGYEIEVMNKDIEAPARSLYVIQKTLYENWRLGWRLPTYNELLEMNKLHLLNPEVNKGWYGEESFKSYHYFNIEKGKLYFRNSNPDPKVYGTIYDGKLDKLVLNVRLVRTIK